ncbi:XrtA system polysaccharide chain length determinant [Aquabacterium sp.]|uniref:XrtA system polysaccharide chain length determinant n=1 Tax=Aquabacterium sp. TaxID=1872578 RepID=UPI003D6CB396
MDDITRQIAGILNAMWQRRWFGVAVAWLIALGSASIVFMMHDRYEASARVYVDTETVLKPLMNGLAFQPDVEQQVRMLARTLISRPNIEQLMRSPRIGLNALSARDHEKVIDRLMKDIKVSPSGNTNLYEIIYRDANPQRAQRVVEELVALFMTAGVGDKQRDSEQARQFLDEQISAYEHKLSDAENKLKDFKLRNFGLTGTSNQDYFARMSSLSDETGRLRVELSAAEQARDALKRELASEEPSIPAEYLNNGGTSQSAGSDLDLRLEAQKRQLDELSRRYTDEHPDVVNTKRAIAQMEQQRRAEAESRARGLANGTRLKAAPTSPVFQRIRVALAEAEAKVASLRGQMGEQHAQLERIRATAGRMPQVEAELAQLNRDYEVVRKNYEQLVSRRESASLGEKIDQTTKVADFRVVEPPRVNPSPVKPSRTLIAMMTIVVALAAGAATMFGITQVFPTVQDTRQLKEISGRPVLGSVSMVISPVMKSSVQLNNRLFALNAAVFLVLNVTWLVVVARQWIS